MTMFNWLTATRMPRRLAGAISVIYIGQTTDAPPTATPPSQRKKSRAYQFHASAHPRAEMTNSTASSASTGRRPHQSAGRPTSNAPTMVPNSALDTVKPRRLSLSSYTCRNASVVPEITAVSKPNSSDPSAATMALSRSIPPPPPRAGEGLGSITMGVCMIGVCVACRHRRAMLPSPTDGSNIYAGRLPRFPRLWTKQRRLQICATLLSALPSFLGEAPPPERGALAESVGAINRVGNGANVRGRTDVLDLLFG